MAKTTTWMTTAALIAVAAVSALPGATAGDTYDETLTQDCAPTNPTDVGERVAQAECFVGTSESPPECSIVRSIEATLNEADPGQDASECLVE